MGVEKEYKYSIGDIVNNMEITERFIIEKQGSKRIYRYKGYKVKCCKCEYETEKVGNQIELSGCACCANKVVVEHINSIVANEETHWMIDYFQGGYNEAKLYTKASCKKVAFRCPHCGKIKDREIRVADLYKNHSVGCDCSGSISYAERVGLALFKHMNVEYIYQYKEVWSEGHLYDFFLPKYNAMVELHGIQHYNPRGFMKDTTENDAHKETLAKIHGIKRYYQIDCRYSTPNWIKDNIVKIDILDFSNVDWVLVFNQAESNIVKQVCDIKKANPNIPTEELCKMFDLSTYAIRTYLKKGHELGWCVNTIPPKRTNPKCTRIGIYKDNMLVREYKSIEECNRNSEEDLGVRITDRRVSQFLSNKINEYKGYVIKKLDTVND